MRTAFLLSMMLFCFAKNGFSVVVPTAGFLSQLVENQQVEPSKQVSKKGLSHFFLNKNRPAIFKKTQPSDRVFKHGNGNRAAVLSFVFGLMAVGFVVPGIWLFLTGLTVAWAVCMVLSLIFAVTALRRKTTLRFLGGFGMFLACFSVTLAVISAIAVAFSGD